MNRNENAIKKDKQSRCTLVRVQYWPNTNLAFVLSIEAMNVCLIFPCFHVRERTFWIINRRQHAADSNQQRLVNILVQKRHLQANTQTDTIRAN